MSTFHETAQDNSRELQQKRRFGFANDEHSRGAKHDAFYKMPIDFKTRNVRKGDGGVSTKRKFNLKVLEEWQNTVIVVSDYEDKNSILESDYIIFPLALAEWRSEQERKLHFNNRANYYSLSEVGRLQKVLEDNHLYSEFAPLFNKFKAEAHLNDPRIPKRLFESQGKKLRVNGQKINTKNSKHFIKVPSGIDKAKFLRNKIDSYIQEVYDGKK
tara:strand:+ start:563 stop:1204 length:642 start_codon:yes stop_codon:yes gene_type:complete